ncbi:MAG: hypothetical protein AAF533_27885 [Acidobacteriota bacterium]
MGVGPVTLPLHEAYRRMRTSGDREAGTIVGEALQEVRRRLERQSPDDLWDDAVSELWLKWDRNPLQSSSWPNDEGHAWGQLHEALRNEWLDLRKKREKSQELPEFPTRLVMADRANALAAERMERLKLAVRRALDGPVLERAVERARGARIRQRRREVHANLRRLLAGEVGFEDLIREERAVGGGTLQQARNRLHSNHRRHRIALQVIIARGHEEGSWSPPDLGWTLTTADWVAALERGVQDLRVRELKRQGDGEELKALMRRQLGLSSYNPIEQDWLPQPIFEEAEGLAPTPDLPLIERIALAEFFPWVVPSLEPTGVSLSHAGTTADRLLLLERHGGTPLVVLPRSVGKVQSQADGSLVVDASAELRVGVRLDEDTVLILVGDEAGRTGVQLFVRSDDAPTVEWPAAPVASWLDGLEDPWMKEETRQCLDPSEPWSLAVAVGTHARLLEPRALGEPTELVQRVRDGDREALAAWHDPPRAWAASLEPCHVRELALLVEAEVDGLRDDLDELDRLDWEEPEWETLLRSVLQARDELASVRWVLCSVRGASFEDAVPRSILELDLVGRAVARTLELERPLDDERLHRALINDPSAWWAWPTERGP